MAAAWVGPALAIVIAGALGVGIWAVPELWGTARPLPPAIADAAATAVSLPVAFCVPADIGGAVALWAAGIAAVADLWERVLPRRWSALVATAGLCRLATGHGLVWPAVAAALGVAALFAGIAAATRGGLGGGDIWFAGAAALAGGWPWGVWGVWAGCAAAALTGLAARAVGCPLRAVPLGPWIALGLIAAVLWAPAASLSS